MHVITCAALLVCRRAADAGRQGSGGETYCESVFSSTVHVKRHSLYYTFAGARLMWGGKALEGHSIPEVYGAMQPTAVFVPLDAMLESDANWELCNTELFGPFQVPR